MTLEREIIEHGGEAVAHVAKELASQLAVVRGDLKRGQDILAEALGGLLGSFQSLNERIHRQRGLAAGISEQAARCLSDPLAISVEQKGDQGVSSVFPAAMLAEFNEISSEVEQALNQAVLSLQFQDVLTQLLAHAERRFDVIEEVVREHERLAGILRDSGSPRAALEALEELRSHMDGFGEKLIALNRGVSNSPVRQSGFARGDIELF